MSTTTFKNLIVWQKSRDLAVKMYKITDEFPKSELYGLTSQMRRAAISIPSNIAEGWSRRTTNAYTNHLRIALGSHAECETCFESASRLGYVPQTEKSELAAALDSTGRLLSGLLRALQAKHQGDGRIGDNLQSDSVENPLPTR